MPEPLQLVLAWLAGLGLGGLYFGGLWWTVGKGLASPRPALWFATSMVLRTAIVLAGFYLVAGAHLPRLLLCLLGFGMARLLVTRLTRPAAANQSCPSAETSHAP
jgi:F1F0 ATPase subunit 2